MARMRLAISTMSYLDHFFGGRWTVADFLDECKRVGVEGIEIQDRHAGIESEHPAQETSYWEKLKKSVAETGLEIAAWTPELFFDNPAEEETRIVRFRELVDVAAMLGTRNVRIFPAAVSTLKACAEHAEEKGRILVLENHGGVTDTAEGHIGLIEQVGSPALRVNLDTGNYPKDPYENIKKTIDSGYVRYVHVKHYGYGEDVDLIDHEKILPLLKASGYDGWLSIEFEGVRQDAKGNNVEKEVVEKIVQEMKGILSRL